MLCRDGDVGSKGDKGLARPGPVFVEARRTAIVSARTGRVPSMELVMPNSRELHASATSIVNQV